MSLVAHFFRTAVLLGVVVCAFVATPAETPPPRWQDFPSHRLANEHLEVVIVPALGRLMHFSRPGGPNLLWTDPDALAPDRNVIHTRYVHWGGDKTWLAPQEKWPEVLGGIWPPDPAWGDAAMGPHLASPLPDGGLRVTGPVSAITGLRVSRDYHLDGDELVITARVENRSATRRAVALWQVTNIPRPDLVYLAPAAHSDYPKGVRIHELPKNPYAPDLVAPVVLKPAGTLLVLDPAPLEGPAKVGLDGDIAALAAAFGEDLFLQRAERLPGPHVHGEAGRAGVCVEYYDHGYAAKRAFAELELLGPLVTLSPGEETHHRIRWQIVRRSDPETLHRLMSKPVYPVASPDLVAPPPIPVAFRADDYGAATGINAGILASVREGVVRNISIIAPGPALDADALAALRQLGPDIALGLHVALNCEWLGQGWRPCAPPAEIPALVDADGLFRFRTPNEIHAARIPLDQLMTEVRAQLAALRAAGLPIAYLDQHMGVGWVLDGALGRALREFARDEGLAFADELPHVSRQFAAGEFARPATPAAPDAPAARWVLHPATRDDSTLRLFLSADEAPGRHADERSADLARARSAELLAACAPDGPLRSVTIPEALSLFR